MDRIPYNTMLKGHRFEVDRSALVSRELGEGPRGMVFRHDLSAPLPPSWMALVKTKCRCIYSELPWRSGWEGFHARADVTPATDISTFHGTVARLIADLVLPAFIVCGKDFMRVSGVDPRPILLNGSRAWLYAVGVPGSVSDAVTTEELLSTLARVFPSVYDPCCGYGNALRYFQSFVGSDLDGKCVDYCFREICQQPFMPPPSKD